MKISAGSKNENWHKRVKINAYSTLSDKSILINVLLVLPDSEFAIKMFGYCEVFFFLLHSPYQLVCFYLHYSLYKRMKTCILQLLLSVLKWFFKPLGDVDV